jgi:hypothetical protein
VKRTISATAEVAFGKTVSHSLKGKIVAITRDFPTHRLEKQVGARAMDRYPTSSIAAEFVGGTSGDGAAARGRSLAG